MDKKKKTLFVYGYSLRESNKNSGYPQCNKRMGRVHLHQI